MNKIVEKIVIKQLTFFLEDIHILHQSQHEFIHGRSALTNLLFFDNRIADILSKGHPLRHHYNIDFKKAFDKASHTAIFQALANAGIADKAFAWFIGFFDKCIQQVEMSDSRSQHVISGFVQGSSIGAIVFTELRDSLLRRLRHFTVAFADGVKFLADVALEKSLVMHLGCNQPMHNYHLQGNQLKTVDCYTDLGIIRSTNHGYKEIKLIFYQRR